MNHGSIRGLGFRVLRAVQLTGNCMAPVNKAQGEAGEMGYLLGVSKEKGNIF